VIGDPLGDLLDRLVGLDRLARLVVGSFGLGHDLRPTRM
jgi:hypothetical protein